MPEPTTNEELLAEVKRLGTLVSMYEAAEGSAYTRETAERLAARKALWLTLGLARERGLDPNTRGFLL